MEIQMVVYGITSLVSAFPTLIGGWSRPPHSIHAFAAVEDNSPANSIQLYNSNWYLAFPKDTKDVRPWTNLRPSGNANRPRFEHLLLDSTNSKT